MDAPGVDRAVYQATGLAAVQRFLPGAGLVVCDAVALLLVYTFVFSVIFKGRWEGMVSDNHDEFALALFAGLIAFNIFSESILTAPNLIVSNQNYVKKVVFPLEILPVSVLGSALIHSLFSLITLLIGSPGCSWTNPLDPHS